MSTINSCLYEGMVVHKRLFPKQHGFAYRVFVLCLDVDEIDSLDASLRLFSRNRRNVMEFCDEDLSEPGKLPVADKARHILRDAGLSHYAARIDLVCYPRLFGYVFNPLSVYFCRDEAGTIGAVIYEVTNTVGERKSYVIPTGGRADTLTQTCAKELYVSPFTAPSGSYGFHAVPPCDRLVIGVNFREQGRPVLKTHFSGQRRPLSDAAIARVTLTHPLMTMKVIVAIHLEAAKLWAKGIPIAPRHTSPPYSFTLVNESEKDTRHA